jgi:hypothetical protein
MTDRISPERKTVYYVGTAMSIVGLLMFLSVFFTFAMNFGDFGNFDAQVRSSMFRTVGGIVLLIAGGAVRNIGARGLAGSGVLLDPERARGELKPYSRMAGGMVGDALEAAELPKNLGTQAERVVMIRCAKCGKLNEEDSKFCQECGQNMAE